MLSAWADGRRLFRRAFEASIRILPEYFTWCTALPSISCTAARSVTRFTPSRGLARPPFSQASRPPDDGHTENAPMSDSKILKPMSHVLVVSADPGWRDDVVAGLNAASAKLDHPFALPAVPAANAQAARAAVIADGDVQIVLIDQGGPAPAGGGGGGAARH